MGFASRFNFLHESSSQIVGGITVREFAVRNVRYVELNKCT